MYEIFLGTGLTTWLENPVQRQSDGDYCKKRQTEQLGALKFLAFQHFVVVVRLAIGSKFNFRTNLGTALTNVEERINCPATKRQYQRQPRNRGGDISEYWRHCLVTTCADAMWTFGFLTSGVGANGRATEYGASIDDHAAVVD